MTETEKPSIEPPPPARQVPRPAAPERGKPDGFPGTNIPLRKIEDIPIPMVEPSTPWERG